MATITAANPTTRSTTHMVARCEDPAPRRARAPRPALPATATHRYQPPEHRSPTRIQPPDDMWPDAPRPCVSRHKNLKENWPINPTIDTRETVTGPVSDVIQASFPRTEETKARPLRQRTTGRGRLQGLRGLADHAIRASGPCRHVPRNEDHAPQFRSLDGNRQCAWPRAQVLGSAVPPLQAEATGIRTARTYSYVLSPVSSHRASAACPGGCANDAARR